MFGFFLWGQRYSGRCVLSSGKILTVFEQKNHFCFCEDANKQTLEFEIPTRYPRMRVGSRSIEADTCPIRGNLTLDDGSCSAFQSQDHLLVACVFAFFLWIEEL